MKSLVYLIFGFFVLVGAVRLAAGFGDDTSDSIAATAVPHFQEAVVRRVAITDDAKVSRNQDPMWVQLVDGSIPPEVTQLQVLTDENCQPDADGVSHCLNRVSFETGGTVHMATLQHHHRMSEESCLAPGEMVILVD
ncbi:MAG: hypothetical protein M3Y37_08210 [Chloroflexota bacterium]|nr:hypothetical protein [Chloroflexota bacterium]